jgi:hypothetical protein
MTYSQTQTEYDVNRARHYFAAKESKITKNGDQSGDQAGYTAVKRRYDASTADIATLTAAALTATAKVTDTAAAATTAATAAADAVKAAAAAAGAAETATTAATADDAMGEEDAAAAIARAKQITDTAQAAGEAQSAAEVAATASADAAAAAAAAAAAETTALAAVDTEKANNARLKTEAAAAQREFVQSSNDAAIQVKEPSTILMSNNFLPSTRNSTLQNLDPTP